MQMISAERKRLTDSDYSSMTQRAFGGPEYVDHLIEVARGRVGVNSEKIAVLKSALTCAYARMEKGAQPWPEIWEGQILKQLERLVGKALFPRWASQNLPFMSAKIRRSRIKLVTEGIATASTPQKEADQEEAQQGNKIPTNISQHRSDKMKAVEYLNKIQEILADQTQDEPAKIKDIFELLKKDHAALISFPDWWYRDYPLTVQMLVEDIKRGKPRRTAAFPH
jgi:hypothetical protein